MKTRPNRPRHACPSTLPRPSEDPTGPSRCPRAVVASNPAGPAAVDKASYRFWRPPSSRPARRLSELPSTRAEEPRRAGGAGGPLAALRPVFPASAARPIVTAIWPAKAALPPRPPPLPRLKLINGSAYRSPSVVRLISAVHLSARNKRRTEARGSCSRGFGGGRGRRPGARPPSNSRPGRR